MTWKITGAPGTGENLLYSQAGTPTLDLRFASSKSLNDHVSGQNLIDFTRGGNGVGTYVGSDGLIKNSVVNLLLRSEEFDNASWAKTNTTITPNDAIAPNGTQTAERLNATTASTARTYQDVTVTAGVSYTASIYAKAGTSTGITFREDAEDGLSVVVDLTTGQVTGGSPTGFSIPVGNGWYRVGFTGSVVGTNFRPEVRTSSTDYIYLWGAQLEQSSTVGEYVKTTSSISGAPRFDHDPETGESLGLLIEESRQNLLLNSATLATQDVTVTAVAHTLSFYGTGTVTLSGTHSATVVGTGAYPTRTTLTFTPTAGTLTVTVSGTVQYANLEIGSFATSWIPTASTTVTRNADTCLISGSNFSRWYSQSQGTVFADAYREFAVPSSFFPHVFDARNTGNDIIQVAYNTETIGTGYSRTSGVDQATLFPTGLSGVRRRRATFAYNINDFAAVVNGGTVFTDNSGTPSSVVNQAALGGQVGSTSFNLNGTIKRLCFFDRRLPNAVLQAITA